MWDVCPAGVVEAGRIAGVAGADRQAVRRVIETTVAASFDLPVVELAAATRRSAPVAFARQVAMYVAHVGLGLSLTETGALFGRDRTTAAHACRVVEDRRDDGDLDCLLDAIEAVVVSWTLTLDWCRGMRQPEPAGETRVA
ncbi:hypothetical protein AB7M35_001591 [Amorphus suaedae]